MASQIKKSDLPVLYGDVPAFMASSIIKDASGLQGQDAVVLGIPYDGVATFRGGATRRASQEIRKFSLLYGGYNLDLGFDIFDYLRVADFGDVDVVPGDTPESYRRAEKKVGAVLEAGAVPLVIGGDHGISIPVCTAVAKRSAEPFGVVVFDTHLDLDEALNDDRLTRASPLKRIIELNGVKPERVAVIGARGPRNVPEWAPLAHELNITYFTMNDIERMGIEQVAQKAFAIATDGGKGAPPYISIDIDSIDPAYAPATNSPEPGGLTSREIINALRIVAHNGFVGFDLVEVVPEYDSAAGITSVLAARLLAEALGALASAKKR